MSLTDLMFLDSKSIWDKCLEIDFVINLYRGVPKLDNLLSYIKEDYIYLFYYTKVFAYAITKSKNMNEIKFLYNMMSFVNESEVNLRNKILIENNIKEDNITKFKPNNVNQKYINHLMYYAENKTIVEIISSLLPCVLSYQYIFEKLKMKYKKIDTKYDELTNPYQSIHYKECCKKWCNFADNLFKNLNDEKKKELIKIYHISSELEYEFWNYFKEN